MKKFIQKIKSFFILLKADWKLRKAIKEADAKYRRYGARFYVIVNYKHELITRSYSQLKQMRKAGYFSNRAVEKYFITESFYYTPSRFGQELSKQRKMKKRQAWLNYVAQAKRLV